MVITMIYWASWFTVLQSLQPQYYKVRGKQQALKAMFQALFVCLLIKINWHYVASISSN